MFAFPSNPKTISSLLFKKKKIYISKDITFRICLVVILGSTFNLSSTWKFLSKELLRVLEKLVGVTHLVRANVGMFEVLGLNPAALPSVGCCKAYGRDWDGDVGGFKFKSQ